MQLRHLRYFIAIAEEGSVLGAARRLHVAQPSISKQIHDLEREVGCALFERVARGVRLTAAGSAFLAEARNTVESASRAIMFARVACQTQTVAVALPKLVLNPPIVPELLGRFRDVHPDCKVHVHLLSDKHQRAALRGQTIIAAVDWVVESQIEDFASLPLLDATMEGALLSSRHPLAHQSSISLQDLKPMTRLYRPRRSADLMYHSLRSALLARGLKPTYQRASSMEAGAVTSQIAGGDCYVLCSQMVARHYINASDAVTFRPFVEEPIPAWLMLYWRRDDQTPMLNSLRSAAERLVVEGDAA